MKLFFHYSDIQGQHKLFENLLSFAKGYHEIVVVCIGTDRVSGDSLGPMVGTFLEEECSGLQVYGTLKEPVHAQNIENTIAFLQEHHEKSFIIAVDACLGKVENLENVMFVNGPLKPGIGVNKELPEIGHVNIQGIVNIGGFMPHLVIQNTRMNTVYNMSRVIAGILSRTVRIHRNDFSVRLNHEKNRLRVLSHINGHIHE